MKLLLVSVFLVSTCISLASARHHGGFGTLSCDGRCSDGYKPDLPCQCNTLCMRYHNCCDDYDQTCASSDSDDQGSGNCMSFSALTQALWDKDADRLAEDDVKIDLQGHITDSDVEDISTGKLFTYVNENRLDSPVFTTYLALLDDFTPEKGLPEDDTAQDKTEIDDFLTAVLATPTMDALYKYLVCRGKTQSTSEFRETLKRVWFDHYPRSGSSSVPDTSGFEHVMVGEYKDSHTVNGLHSWLSYYTKEKAGDIDYYGYWEIVEPKMAIATAFQWSGHLKVKGSFFLRTSPAFDMAVDTACYLEYAGRSCPVRINGKSLSIRAYSADGHLATSFVVA